jgi:hypothetical protein
MGNRFRSYFIGGVMRGIKSLKCVGMALIAVMALALAGCGDKGVEAGGLPRPQIGDKWASNWFTSDGDFLFSGEVTGEDTVEGKRTWKVEFEIEPAAFDAFDKMVMYADKETMDVVRTHLSGRARGSSVSIGSAFRYEYTGPTLYPLAVGKEVKVKETEETTSTIAGRTTTEMEVKNYTYRVEAPELVTIPLGRFESYKVVKYDEDGEIVSIQWMSDKVGPFEVKFEGRVDDMTIELVSYSYKAGEWR